MTIEQKISDDPEPIHLWFNLTYANYLTLPRSVLQSMPREWQAKFVDLLEEMRERYGGLDWPDYHVKAKRDGKFIQDPIPSYDRGRTRLPVTP